MLVSVELGTMDDSRLVSTLIVTAVFTTGGLVVFIAAVCVCAKQSVHLDGNYEARAADIEKRVDQQQTLKADVKVAVYATKLKHQRKNHRDRKDASCSDTLRTEMELLTTDQSGGRTVPEAQSAIAREVADSSQSVDEASTIEKSSLYFWLLLLGTFILPTIAHP